MKRTNASNSPDFRPLAEKVRPTRLADIVGHANLVGDAGFLRSVIDKAIATNILFWGPPGSGKTTLARIIARESNADYVEISAVQAKKSDVNAVIERATANQTKGTRTLLFVDEIHRFNKAQQDAFLPHVESGLLTLIGATTENPSFEIIRPLLSRSRVVVLRPLARDEVIEIMRRAVLAHHPDANIDSEALEAAAQLAGGDARKALGIIEVALSLSSTVDTATIEAAAQTKTRSFDKAGDMHYDLSSAFIKSLRGSNENAALYYLSRLLAAGEDPLFIARRMIIFASEDIGLAGNGALSLAVAAYDATQRIGLPEANYILYHCASALARSAKSREITDKMYAAKELEKKFPDADVPLHLRNAPTKLMKDLGYNEGYEWKANFKHNEGFLPKEIENHIT